MIIGGFLGIIAGLAGLLWGIFLRDKSGVDVLLERSSAFVLLAVLLVIAGCVLFVVGIRKQAEQKKIIKETLKLTENDTLCFFSSLNKKGAEQLNDILFGDLSQ